MREQHRKSHAVTSTVCVGTCWKPLRNNVNPGQTESRHCSSVTPDRDTDGGGAPLADPGGTGGESTDDVSGDATVQATCPPSCCSDSP